MPFTAKIAGTTRCVSMLDPNDAAAINDHHSGFECKACGTAMRIKKGVFNATSKFTRRSHFFHMPQPAETAKCAMLEYQSGETEDHRQLKAAVAADLPGFIPNLVNDPPVHVELERWLPECGENGRIADVYVETKSGYRIAVEIQLSMLPAPTLAQRSTDYLDADITPFWILIEGQTTDEQERVLDRLSLDRMMVTAVRSRESVRGTP